MVDLKVRILGSTLKTFWFDFHISFSFQYFLLLLHGKEKEIFWASMQIGEASGL